MGVGARAVGLAGRLLLIGPLVGCASQGGWWTFEKPGMTEIQLQLDQNECFSRSIEGTSPESGGLVRVSRDTYRRCMEERGYVARLGVN